MPHHNSHLQALRTGSAGLAAAARKGGLDIPIPTCPGWSMADLVWHTGTLVHWSAQSTALFAGHVEGERPPAPQAPDDHQLIDWLEEGAELLVASLLEHDPDDTAGQRCPPGYPGPSLYRHYAREVDLHRWDAEHAIGAPGPLDDELAVEWLDLMLTAWLPTAGRIGNQAQGPWTGEAVHFCGTDARTGGEWLVRLHGAGKVETTREHAAADVTVAGPASALLLLAMNRIAPTDPDLHVSGDVGLLEFWATEVRYGRPAAGAHWLGSPRPSSREVPANPFQAQTQAR